MKQTPLLLCLTGLVLDAASVLGNLPHKYELIMTLHSWQDAQNYCRAMYTDLATVVSDTDIVRLNREAERQGLAAPAWVGLYDDYTSWRWSLDDSRLKDTIYTNWASGQPNNALSLEACVMVGSTGKWLDTSCKFLRAFICYDASLSGADKFIGYASLVIWSEAQAYCRTHHTDLASSLSSSDQSLLTQLRSTQSDSWIGLYRETWKWSDGTNISTIPWAPRQPDNSERIMGSCASVNNGLLGDEPCANLHYFFCHTIPPVRTHVKLQVKFYGSVFDPAVQSSSIVELMKQKLEQRGMLENTTVTWRLQTDGNIFIKKKRMICDIVDCKHCT